MCHVARAHFLAAARARRHASYGMDEWPMDARYCLRARFCAPLARAVASCAFSVAFLAFSTSSCLAEYRQL